ncbi:nitroreductase [Oceanicella actignis]|uniref:nitroreductase n=1 Tax=Oceanicella actignis TaxID=1189325 RepID=UPI0011E827C0|nr:nitroreductase [Oceanicella actignis]TYO89134.1 nitroreductase [Oceanicella actignis]
MNVSEAVARRISVRAFLPDPVPRALIAEVLEKAARAPSGGNLQPWLVTVLEGPSMARFRETMRARLAQGGPDPLEYPIYPEKLHEPYRTRRHRVGEQMYALLGIPREDRAARLRRLQANYDFFGAPAGLFVHVDRRMGAAQWADLGMFLQTVMLLFVEAGYDTCAQEAWAWHHRTVDAFVGADPATMLFCGMAIGKRDPDSPVNRLRAERAPLEEFARFL